MTMLQQHLTTSLSATIPRSAIQSSISHAISFGGENCKSITFNCSWPSRGKSVSECVVAPEMHTSLKSAMHEAPGPTGTVIFGALYAGKCLTRHRRVGFATAKTVLYAGCT